MLVKEIVYAVLDLTKGISDDFTYTEDFVLFLLKKYRSFLIRKEQEKDKAASSVSSEFETQQICLDLEKVAAIDGQACTGGYYLRTVQRVPKILEGNQPTVYPVDFYQGTNVSYVSRERMRFIGTNPYLQNIIYASLGPDMRLYLNSNNPQFLYLRKLRVSAVFEDFDEVTDFLCDTDGNPDECDVLDSEFPVREYLVPTLIELVVKELVGASYRPADRQNDANDNLADLANFIRNNVKSTLQKQIEG